MGALVSLSSANAAPPGAVACSGCHAQAKSGGAIPSLEALSAEEIALAMRAFKTGERASTVMDRIAKGFSDEEIGAIAQWLAKGAERDSNAAEP